MSGARLGDRHGPTGDPSDGAAAEALEVERDAARVVGRLRETFASGRTRPLSWRRAQLGALESLCARESRAIEEALAADLGRNPMEAYLAEISGIQREARVLRRGIARWSRPEPVRTPLVLRPARSSVRREPLGVVLIVGPWNYPVNLVLAPLAAALAAGNCAVVKPSEQAPACSALLARLLPRYLDPDAVAVVEGGAEITGALIDSGIDHLLFTGSPAVGRLVAERAARKLVPVTLELGGKSPAVVAADADLDVAARRIAWGKFMNAGQSCIAPDYVLVDASRLEALALALWEALRQLYGDDPASSPDYGRIVNGAHVARLQRLLENHGGKVMTGGVVDPARRYVAPTLILRPSTTSALMEEEIFGPVLPLLAVADLDEAVRFLAARPAPLALYVFTAERSAAERFVADTRSGTVAINTTMHQFASSELPFGGVGTSGSGRYHGRFGFDTFSQLRPVLDKATRPDLSFAYPPYRRTEGRLLRFLLGLPSSGSKRRGAPYPALPASPAVPFSVDGAISDPSGGAGNPGDGSPSTG
ncbi:MAG: aldehyde dehydrogenase [Acidimicrobiaceae bacterium]|nr:aldehyde dehydrogenase [Acidimicrobiaceae bacterium]